jgi:hypothetical protein
MLPVFLHACTDCPLHFIPNLTGNHPAAQCYTSRLNMDVVTRGYTLTPESYR